MLKEIAEYAHFVSAWLARHTFVQNIIYIVVFGLMIVFIIKTCHIYYIGRDGIKVSEPKVEKKRVIRRKPKEAK